MSDSLDAAMDALMDAYGDFIRRTSDGADIPAARAALRKAAREMGEEFEVQRALMDGWPDCLVVLPMKHYAPGSLVRVVKVEP